MPKTLLVFCDGTGMDGSLAPPKSEVLEPGHMFGEGALPPLEGGDNNQYATNVLRLARSVKSLDEKGNRQIVFYQSGVGSEADFNGENPYATIALKAAGTAVASKIRDAYVFIAQNYDVGDDVCLFGFSRGAYTARKLSGLIDRIGLLTTHNLGHFFEIWRALVRAETPKIPDDTRRAIIKCVGVWDTVGSVLSEIDALHIADTDLPKTIKNAFHAVSVHENRDKFLPTLWTVPDEGLGADQVFKQIWFPGAHSDVGGGYERHELADISLFWMAGEVKSLINLDLDFLRSYSQANPDAWGVSQPHNAYKELSIAQKVFISPKTRLESRQITQSTVFHESFQYSPTQLKSPSNMITLPIIAQKLNPGFTPRYQALNEFEKYCKEHWGKGLNASPGGIEDPRIVVGSRLQWVAPEQGVVPADAVVGGHDAHGKSLYIARMRYKDSLTPGNADSESIRIAYVGDGLVHTFSLKQQGQGIEFLVGNQSSIHWVPMKILDFADFKKATPVRAGYDGNGKDLYLARIAVGAGVYPGRIGVYAGGGRAPVEDTEIIASECDVLFFV